MTDALEYLNGVRTKSENMCELYGGKPDGYAESRQAALYAEHGKLATALIGVLELHHKSPVTLDCDFCGGAFDYPCPTVRRVTDALAITEEDS